MSGRPAFLFAVIASGLLAASCAPAPTEIGEPQPMPTPSECPVLASRDWKAWINAMPGPGAARTLYITGEVDLPTPGYTVVLVPGPADRMMPPGQRFSLVATPASGIVAQVVTATPVRFEGPATYPAYRALVIGCGGKALAEITDIETAH